MKQDKKVTETKFETVKSVPYQVCPMCYGRGVIHESTTTHYSYNTTVLPCGVCKGKKIIPQFIINQP